MGSKVSEDMVCTYSLKDTMGHEDHDVRENEVWNSDKNLLNKNYHDSKSFQLLHHFKLMGIGHRQFSFEKTNYQHRYCHGGILRRKRAGRRQRPLACKEALHVVFKVDRSRLRYSSLRSAQSFTLVHELIKKYAVKFFVKVEQLSIQNDHIHILVRTNKRSHFHFFFRVVAGQIAQRFQNQRLLLDSAKKPVTDTHSGNGTGLWKYRPFSRVVIGWRAFNIVRNYIQLNEQEARGKIKYQKNRLRGLSSGEWQILWS